jgi:predicted RNA binding protein YcfA (HicA-like mRNA interferase family)
MTKLPSISGHDLAKALGRAGFYVKRQHGSHIILRRDNPFAQKIVPDHRELDRGTLRSILRDANLSAEDLSGLK